MARQGIWTGAGAGGDPPSTNFAREIRRNAQTAYQYEDTVDKEMVFQGKLTGYNNGGFTVKGQAMAASATTGNFVVQYALRRRRGNDLDTKTFAAFVSTGQVNVTVASGVPISFQVNISHGSAADDLADGDDFDLLERRDADDTSATDNMTGGLQIFSRELVEQ